MQTEHNPFSNEVAEFYLSLGWEVKVRPKTAQAPDSLFIRWSYAGTTHSAIVYCPDAWKEDFQIHLDGNLPDSGDIQRLIVTPRKLAEKTTGKLVSAGIRTLSYHELISETTGLEKYVQLLLEKCASWRNETWNGQNWFVRPDLSIEGKLGRHAAIDRIEAWVRAAEPRMLVVLGPTGIGKTMLLHNVAHDMARNYLQDPAHHPAPILIRFGESHPNVTLETLLVKHFRDMNLPAEGFSQLEHLAKYRRIVILFDAYEEMSDAANADFTLKNFSELKRHADQGWKLIFTWRTESCIDFLYRSRPMADPNEKRNVSNLLHEWTNREESFECMQLLDFTSVQMHDYLQKVRPDTPADHWEGFIHARDLAALSRHPVFLHLMAKQLPAPASATDEQEIELYAAFVQFWRQREQKRGRLQDEATILPLLSDLAWRMWLYEKDRISPRQLQQLIDKFFKERHRTRGLEQVDVITRQVAGAAIFTHDAAGNLSFLHSSFRDYLIARELHAVLQRASEQADQFHEARHLLQFKLLSPKILRFLCMQDLQWQGYPTLGKILQEKYEKTVSENALLILYTLANSRCDAGLTPAQRREAMANAIPPRIKMATADLPGMNLSAATLREADFEGANLSHAIFDDADLQFANFRGANLADASFKDARLEYAIGLS